MKKSVLLSVIVSITILLSIACTKFEDKDTISSTLNLNSSNRSPEFDLGRTLFYDTKLSLGNSVSCASCHKQINAFSDNMAFSPGFQGQSTLRNTPPIQNIESFDMESFTFLFWDGREMNLQKMVSKPIMNHIEMGMFDAKTLEDRLKNVPYYVALFEAAYGKPEITAEKISNALAIFTGSITSHNSRFDLQQLNATERIGKDLFFGKYNCGSCHNLFNSKGYEAGNPSMNQFVAPFANIGLDEIYADSGRSAITQRDADIGKFKIPNLRNVAVTAPYMHDGRFKTLDEVLDHYSHGIQNNTNLDARLKNPDGSIKQLNISAADRENIIAFLNALTDAKMITNPDFANPFKKN